MPLVAIPITYDQPGVAARIAYHRVGEFIALDDLTAGGLSATIRKVLDDPPYRDRARSFRAAIAAANGLEVACDLIEAAFGIGAPPAEIRPAQSVGAGWSTGGTTRPAAHA